MSDRDDGVGRRREGAPTEAVASPREAVGADGKRHSSQRAGACEGELRETYAPSRSRNHLSVESGRRVPQETAPQVWLVDPCKPGLVGSPSCCSARGRPTRRRT